MINHKLDLRWKDAYCIGLEKIDEENKHLFGIGERLTLAIENDQANEKIRDIIVELFSYAKGHFKSEEAIMKQTRYPFIKAHQKMHRNVVEKMVAMMQKSVTKKALSENLQHLLIEWLVNHILYEDRKFKSHLQRIEFGTLNNSINKESYNNFLDSF